MNDQRHGTISRRIAGAVDTAPGTPATVTENYQYWPLEVLANHIQSIELRIANTDLPFLRQQFSIVCLKHRRIHPEITGVAHLFDEFAEGLGREIGYDMETALVYVRSVERCHTSGECLERPSFRSVSRLADDFRKRAAQTKKDLTIIREMVSAYDRQGVSDLAISQLTGRLDELSHSLSVVLQLKLDVLFPRTIEMENTVNRAAGQ